MFSQLFSGHVDTVVELTLASLLISLKVSVGVTDDIFPEYFIVQRLMKFIAYIIMTCTKTFFSIIN